MYFGIITILSMLGCCNEVWAEYKDISEIIDALPAKSR